MYETEEFRLHSHARERAEVVAWWGVRWGEGWVGIFPVCADHSPRPSLDNDQHTRVRVTAPPTRANAMAFCQFLSTGDSVVTIVCSVDLVLQNSESRRVASEIRKCCGGGRCLAIGSCKNSITLDNPTGQWQKGCVGCGWCIPAIMRTLPPISWVSGV